LTPAGNPDFYNMTEPYDFEPFQNKVWFGLDGPTNGGLLRSEGTLAGTHLNCDSKNGHIINDKEAIVLWSRQYEKGWEVKL